MKRGQESFDSSFASSQAVVDWIDAVAPYGVFTTDLSLRVVSWNQWLALQSGISAEFAIGRTLAELYPDVTERRLLDHFRRALMGEASVLSTALHKYLLPFPIRTPSAKGAWMLQTVRIAPLRSANEVIGTITTIEDVTQRETQALILQRQQELDRALSAALAALLESGDPDLHIAQIFPTISPILALDAYASYRWDAGLRRFRLSATAGVTAGLRDTISGLPLADGDKVGTDGAIPRTVEALRAMLESVGWTACAIFPLNAGRRVVGLTAFGSYGGTVVPEVDRTVLSRIARYLALALDRALREQEAIAASRAKDDFLAALSHELRTPLNPVLLLASDSIDNPEYPESAREAFRAIEKNALLEARLIDDLLDLTRIEHGKIGLQFEALEIHAVFRDALAMLSRDAADKAIQLTVELNATHSHVSGDPGRLQQVFWNLLKNAVKFTPAGGSVTIRSSSDADTFRLEVVDSGIGMSAHEIGRVFDAFVQGDHAARASGHRFGGLGLGLAISRKLVELHGGRIAATSAGKGLGSTFTIDLPLAKRTGSGGQGSAEAVDARTKHVFRSVGGRPTRILLVEDHEPTRAPLKMLLTRRGFQVVTTSNCAEALAEAAKEAFDLVLSDIGLPDGDGYSLMSTLRERHNARGIALTGYGSDEDVQRSTDAGFVAHLTKPISVAMLDRALAAVLLPDAARE